MSKELEPGTNPQTPKPPKPYTAIPGYFDKSPAELSCKGGPMEYSPLVTALARRTLNAAFSDIIIEDADVETYMQTGPAVVVPTHRSMLDMSILSHLGELSGEGQPYFLSKRENMDNPLTARFFGKMRTFPIDRDMPGQNWTSVLAKWSRFALSNGADYADKYPELVDKPRKEVIFGEGTRKKGPVVESMHNGPLIIAKRNKALILPVGIAGTDQFRLRDARGIAVVAVGDPFEVTNIKDDEILVVKVQEQFDLANEKLAKYSKK
jgi:1-acyl-sn-glycerol-3-phosphate acyltransferase